MRASSFRCAASVAIVAALLSNAVTAADDQGEAQVRISGTAFVFDGDTMEIAGHRIRLFGMDAPELMQSCIRASGLAWACGTEAKDALADIVDGQRVDCLQRDVDRYRRIVAVCHAGRREINAALVADGWALAYQQYSKDYLDEERLAQSAKRGLWRGTFENPWDYRSSDERDIEVAATQPAANCKIKGNISAAGDRIFHVSGGEFYERTEINTAAGERWFCSERDALAAGWRKSRR